MVSKAGKHQRSEQAGQDLCWKVYDPAHLLLYAQWLCMNYIIGMFLQVCCMCTHNHLLYFARFVQGQLLKIANKNLQQKNFARFPNHLPSLIMFYVTTVFSSSSVRFLFGYHSKAYSLWWQISFPWCLARVSRSWWTWRENLACSHKSWTSAWQPLVCW